MATEEEQLMRDLDRKGGGGIHHSHAAESSPPFQARRRPHRGRPGLPASGELVQGRSLPAARQKQGATNVRFGFEKRKQPQQNSPFFSSLPPSPVDCCGSSPYQAKTEYGLRIREDKLSGHKVNCRRSENRRMRRKIINNIVCCT